MYDGKVLIATIFLLMLIQVRSWAFTYDNHLDVTSRKDVKRDTSSRNRGIGLQQFDDSAVSNDQVTSNTVSNNEVTNDAASYDDAVTGDSSKTEEGGRVGLQALQNALKWVKSQMDRDWGWGLDTPHTLLAFSLANPEVFANRSLEAQLMEKEFRIQLVMRLWRDKDSALSAGHLALNVLTLMSLCRDPRDFYSKDLIGILEHRDPVVDFENAFTLLAKCTAGRHLRRAKIRRLLDVIHDHSRIHSIDTLAVSILVLECSQKQRKKDMRRYINDSVKYLLERQYQDGSFASNLHSTAIALQALSASGYGSSWNATTAFQYVMSHQMPDGSFGNLFDTNAVLPLLKGKTLLSVAERRCMDDTTGLYGPYDNPELEESVMKEFPKTEKDPTQHSINSTVNQNKKQTKMINMTYIIWAGNDATLQYNMTFTVPENTTFLEIMKMAAERNKHFEFSASKWANGYYIHTLAGQQEKQVGYWFWLLYKLREPPVPGTKPDNKFVVAQGVQELMPEDGDYILFWYHKI